MYPSTPTVYLTPIGLLHPTGANDVLGLTPFVRDFFLSSTQPPCSM